MQTLATVHLVRHGEVHNPDRVLYGRLPEFGLSELGHEMARGVAAWFAERAAQTGRAPAVVAASPLTRAQQTAAPLAASRALEAVIVDGIQEIAAGVEEMSTNWQPYVDMLNSWSPTNLDVGLEGGETARQFVTRFTNAVAAMEQAGDEHVALVSHGAALRVWAITQDPTIGFDLAPPLANTQWITLNGSMTAGWRIERWGDSFPAPTAG